MSQVDCWKLGSTTAREPTRLIGALIVLHRDVRGLTWGLDAERRFAECLIESKVYLPESKLTKSNLEKIGRTWVSPLSQFGFVKTTSGEAVQVLPPGFAWLNGERPSPIWMRQLLKFQIPNPGHEFSSKAYLHFELRPFLLLLTALYQARTHNTDVSKREVAANILTCHSHKEFEQRCSEDPLWFKSIFAPPSNTLCTYADVTVKYAAMSGVLDLFGQSVRLIDSAYSLVEDILAQSWPMVADEEYQNMLSNVSTPLLNAYTPTVYYGGIKSETLRMLEASVESLNLAITGLSLPAARSGAEELSRTAPSLGLLGASFELALAACIAQAVGESALRRDEKFFKTGQEVLDLFQDTLKKRLGNLTFLTVGIVDDSAHLDLLILLSRELALLVGVRAKALHAGRGLIHDLAVVYARNVANFLNSVLRSSVLRALVPRVPYPSNVVREKTLIIDEISARLRQGANRDDKYDLVLSAIYLVLPDLPQEAPDWLLGMEKLATSPGESDLAYAMQVLEKASPATFVKVRPSSAEAIPVKFAKVGEGVPVEPHLMGRPLTGLQDRVRAEIALVEGKLQQPLRFRGPYVEKELLYELFAVGLDEFVKGLGTGLTAQQLGPLIISALSVQGTEVPYYFMLKHSDDLGQLSSHLKKISMQVTDTLRTKIERVVHEIEHIKKRVAIKNDKIKSILADIQSRAAYRTSQLDKLGNDGVRLPSVLHATLRSVLNNTDSITAGIIRTIETNQENSAVYDEDRLKCLRVLCSLPPDAGAGSGYLQVMKVQQYQPIYTVVRKGFCILDYQSLVGTQLP